MGVGEATATLRFVDDVVGGEFKGGQGEGARREEDEAAVDGGVREEDEPPGRVWKGVEGVLRTGHEVALEGVVSEEVEEDEEGEDVGGVGGEGHGCSDVGRSSHTPRM